MATATNDQLEALVQIWNTANRHIGTSGGNACVKLLLSCYNGHRFKYDLTDLRLLDELNLDSALQVLRMDARPSMEVHEHLNLLMIRNDVGPQLELMAWNLRLPGRATKASIDADLKRCAARRATS